MDNNIWSKGHSVKIVHSISSFPTMRLFSKFVAHNKKPSKKLTNPAINTVNCLLLSLRSNSFCDTQLTGQSGEPLTPHLETRRGSRGAAFKFYVTCRAITSILIFRGFRPPSKASATIKMGIDCRRLYGGGAIKQLPKSSPFPDSLFIILEISICAVAPQFNTRESFAWTRLSDSLNCRFVSTSDSHFLGSSFPLRLGFYLTLLLMVLILR